MKPIYSGPTLAFLRYPQYSEKDKRDHEGHPFFYKYKPTEPLTPDAQVGRVVAGAGFQFPDDDAAVLLPRSSDLPHVRGYMREQFGDLMAREDQLRFYDGPYGYIPHIRENMDRYVGGVVPLAVYLPHHIPEEAYYMDPGNHVALNDKSRMEEYCAPQDLPKRINIPATRIREFRNEFPLPFYVKGKSASGGDAIFYVKSETDVAAVLELLGDQEVILEESIQHDKNYNIQSITYPDGQHTPLGYSVQRVSPDGAHLGNIVDTQETWEDLPEAVRNVVINTLGKAHEVFDWHGISGLDVLYDTPKGQATVIDPNFRNNASTPLQITRARLGQHRLLTMGAVKYKGTEAEFVRLLETCRLNGQMLQEVLHPFGGAVDQESKILKLYAAIGASSAEALDHIPALLQQNGIDFA